MNKLNQLWAIGGIAVALAFSRTDVRAQGGGPPGGGFGGGGIVLSSPARLQEQANNMRMTLGVTNDDEWLVISPRLVSVIQLQAEARVAALARMSARASTTLAVAADPAADALTKALADNAPIAEVKSAMARVRQARKAKLAEMAKAQADLQAVVTVRQEAILLNSGLLD
jgi:hypothetical protein